MNRTVTTAEEIRELFDGGRSAVLLDKGGFVWWTTYVDDGPWLAGSACRARSGETGMAIEAFMNLMSPGQAAPYGPFTVIHRGRA